MTRYIQRHSLLTRVTHGVAAITCILLAVTGLFVFWPELGGSIMGGEFTYWMRMLHRVFAIPFILVPLYAVFKSPKGAAHLFKEDIFGKWDKDDYKWAMLFPFYLFAPSKSICLRSTMSNRRSVWLTAHWCSSASSWRLPVWCCGSIRACSLTAA